MPNPANVTSPILVIGPGRGGSSWMLHALDEHPDVRDVIENTVVDASRRLMLEDWWSRDWKWVCDDDEARKRAVAATRQTLCTLFPTHQKHWVMKAIWREPDLAWHREVFPDAKWIHLTRSPTTNIPSMQERIGKKFKELSHCEAQYVESHRNALEVESWGVPYIRVRQEDAAADPSGVWSRLSEFFGLAPAPEGRLEAEINAAPSMKGSVRDGRSEMSWSELSPEVHEIARRLGYEPDEPEVRRVPLRKRLWKS